MTERLYNRSELFEWANYFEMTKPGILMGNLLTALAGFLLAMSSTFEWKSLGSVLAGLLLVMASSCVFNNYIDREYDAKMTRTACRALATKAIPHFYALTFASLLGVGGFSILAFYSHPLALILTSLAFIVYVLFYSFLKHKSPLATLVGSLAGAAPPVIGYCALSHRWDSGAWLLFITLVCWQMPHFYAIALFRIKDYQKASIPVLPLSKGILRTKISILGYLLALQGVLFAFPLLGWTKWSFFYLLTLLNIGWIALSIKGFWAKNSIRWARQMFFYSLGLILTFSLCLVLLKT